MEIEHRVKCVFATSVQKVSHGKKNPANITEVENKKNGISLRLLDMR